MTTKERLADRHVYIYIYISLYIYIYILLKNLMLAPAFCKGFIFLFVSTYFSLLLAVVGWRAGFASLFNSSLFFFYSAYNNEIKRQQAATATLLSYKGSGKKSTNVLPRNRAIGIKGGRKKAVENFRKKGQ